ncbi:MULTISPECIES: molybdopterin-dependent oxidoreductase [unclassified Streptomyces]|uniref:molybdopterin-dependent oxidoreductase n=1 Tax=unclassified Streptomyces TaxID=2593676 RepID=UPI0006893D85|nr:MULTISPECIES: molybdopterin-dependent oxidoreductase [unclassified Streptomyces]
MRFTSPPGPPITFTARLHDARTATVIGRLLGLALVVCFATGVLSHFLQHPPLWSADRLPSRPYWGYRLSQGLHVASGTAAIPLLAAKLWTVYPRLFAWPPVRSVLHALERLSVAVLVAAAVFELFTGLLNTFQWYPWPFSFVPVHYAVGWLLLGALLLHVSVQWPRIRDHFTRRSPGTQALSEADGPDRRQLLAAVAAGVGAVTLTTVGQSVTALGPLELFGPRSPAHGPQGLPVNRTAAAAGVTAASLDGWRLTLAGPRPAALTLEELRALPQYEVTLPLACVEGWSKSARWTGVRVRDLLELAGGGPGARCRVVSLEAVGAYRVMEMGRMYAQDPLTLLALRLNGEVLSLDHGYPARIIAPNRPGVLQTKWVGRLEVA